VCGCPCGNIVNGRVEDEMVEGRRSRLGGIKTLLNGGIRTLEKSNKTKETESVLKCINPWSWAGNAHLIQPNNNATGGSGTFAENPV